MTFEQVTQCQRSNVLLLQHTGGKNSCLEKYMEHRGWSSEWDFVEVSSGTWPQGTCYFKSNIRHFAVI